MIEFPDKKYRIIYADPPWSYRDKAKSGDRGVEFKYPTMPLQEIKDLPIRDIADENCALFLWATAPQMDKVIEVMEEWGFKYKTIAFTWIKTNKVSGTPFWGMGNWTRANAEFCLLGTRGKPKRVSASVHSVIMSPIEKHSKKPDETRDRIVQLMGPLPRIELFARARVDGWDAWGNEV